MAAPLSPLIASELEMARTLRQLRASLLGHVGWSPALVEAVTKSVFPFATEFWAALAPMQRRGDGWLSLAVPSAARCWPAEAERSLDSTFAVGQPGDLDEVRVEALTGRWEDANGTGAGFAYAAGAAARVWRRPDAPCTPLQAGERLLAQFGKAVLLERMAARGHAVDTDEEER